LLGWKFLDAGVFLVFVIICLCLLQMDGFDQTVNVKVIMATNRADTLDPALLRPGRLDRKIEFPLPDRRQKRLVFQVSCLFV
jgi:26S proteasome regulatory subunit T3